MLVIGCLAAMIMISCMGKNTEDLIIGTWELETSTYQSTGHPDQSLNGIWTETFGVENGMSMTFNKDGSGNSVNSRLVHDRIYVYINDTTLRYSHDTTFYSHDTTLFTYFATGNLLVINSGPQSANYRIDQLDNNVLSITDTNVYTDIYTNSYGRSMHFTQETKTVRTFRRR